MNKRQKFQVCLAALIVIYIIVLLFNPGWKVGKILGIFASVCTLIALYLTGGQSPCEVFDYES